MFGKKFFSFRTADDSVITPAARPNLFEHAVRKIKKAFTNSFASEKNEQISQDIQTIESLVQTPQAHPVAQGTLVPFSGTTATSSPFLSPPSRTDCTEGESSIPPSVPTPTTSPTASSSTPLSIVPCQEAMELAAAKKKLAELEVTNAQRKLEYANYRERVERMHLSARIKTLTGDRDLFKARLKRAEQELVRKTEERSKMEQEWKEEYGRREWAQLRVLGAKRGLEESGKEYAALEAKFLELQSRFDYPHDEVEEATPDYQGSAAGDDEHQGLVDNGPCPSQWLKRRLSSGK
ncbi:hypothetical protein FS837_008927 [Tulasnella sp. UAMH 9824]|nr:hypothetical protein FS837_008927 [Tulasnella sp. UAMH 9824]